MLFPYPSFLHISPQLSTCINLDHHASEAVNVSIAKWLRLVLKLLTHDNSQLWFCITLQDTEETQTQNMWG